MEDRTLWQQPLATPAGGVLSGHVPEVTLPGGAIAAALLACLKSTHSLPCSIKDSVTAVVFAPTSSLVAAALGKFV